MLFIESPRPLLYPLLFDIVAHRHSIETVFLLPHPVVHPIEVVLRHLEEVGVLLCISALFALRALDLQDTLLPQRVSCLHRTDIIEALLGPQKSLQ